MSAPPHRAATSSWGWNSSGTCTPPPRRGQGEGLGASRTDHRLCRAPTQVVTQSHTRLVTACAAGPVVTQKHPGTRIQVADTLRHFCPFDSFPLAVFKS